MTVAEIRVRRHEQKAARQRATREAGAAVDRDGSRPRVAHAKARLAAAQRAAAEQPPVQTGDDADAEDRPAQANTTDPDSRTMKTANGWVQGYNAQAWSTATMWCSQPMSPRTTTTSASSDR